MSMSIEQWTEFQSDSIKKWICADCSEVVESSLSDPDQSSLSVSSDSLSSSSCSSFSISASSHRSDEKLDDELMVLDF